jgi:hypothetical protein
MLPFCLQYAVYLTHPASMNVSCGVIYMIAMIVSAIGTKLCGQMAPAAFVSWFCVLVSLEVCLGLGE